MKLKFTIFCIFSFLIIFSTLSSNDVTYNTTTNNLNVREKPSITSKTIAKLDINTKIELISITDIYSKVKDITAPWLKIRLNNGKTGYVFGGYINENYYGIIESMAIREASNSIYNNSIIYIINNNTQLYRYPTDESEGLVKIRNKSQVKVIKTYITQKSIKKNIYWLFVNYNGKYGYLESNKIMMNAISKKSVLYGINQYPIGIDDEYGEYAAHSIYAYSTKTDKVIHNFDFIDKKDYITIVEDKRFDHFFKDNYIIIKFDMGCYDVCGASYSGYSFHNISKNGEISKSLFHYFTEAGSNDSDPIITNTKINIQDKSISLDYNLTYYDKNQIEGKIKIVYSLEKNKFNFYKIRAKL